MKKTLAQVHNELIDRVMYEQEIIEENRINGQRISDYQIGYYDSISSFLKWIEEDESQN